MKLSVVIGILSVYNSIVIVPNVVFIIANGWETILFNSREGCQSKFAHGIIPACLRTILGKNFKNGYFKPIQSSQ